MKILMPFVLAGVMASAAYAAPAGEGSCCPTAKKAAKSADLVCPVMNKKIASVDKAVGKSTYQGKTYYFCCGGCKTQFDKNPAKYAAKPAGKKG